MSNSANSRSYYNSDQRRPQHYDDRDRRGNYDQPQRYSDRRVFDERRNDSRQQPRRDGYSPNYDNRRQRSFSPQSRDDRDDRDYQRRSASPPRRNAAPSTSSDIADPLSLPYLVNFRQFCNYFKSSDRNGAGNSEAELQLEFEEYKKDFGRKTLANHFQELKRHQYFAELYDDKFKDVRKELHTLAAVGHVERFVEDVRTGISSDFTDVERAAQDKDVLSESATRVLLAEGKNEVLLAPTPNVVVITSIPANVPRTSLEAVFAAYAGYRYLAFSDPDPTHAFIRTGMAVFDTAEHALEACKASADFNVRFAGPNGSEEIASLHATVQLDSTRFPITLAAPIMSSPERMAIDLDNVKRIVARFEADSGDTRGSEAIAVSLTSAMESDDAGRTREMLDMHLHLLRTAFHTCYYCACICSTPETLLHRCAMHLRKSATLRDELDATKYPQNFESKVPLMIADNLDPLEYGGDTPDDALRRLCIPHIKSEEGGSKHRCAQCQKLFSARKFVEKHLQSKHSDAIGVGMGDMEYFNNFVLDPGHVLPPPPVIPTGPASMSSRSTQAQNEGNEDGTRRGSLVDRLGPRGEENKKRSRNGDDYRPRPPPSGARLDPRASRAASSYADLDNAPSGDVVLPY